MHLSGTIGDRNNNVRDIYGQEKDMDRCIYKGTIIDICANFFQISYVPISCPVERLFIYIYKE